MKWVFIVNKVAGDGRSLKVSEALKSYCEENNISYDMHFTRSPGEATKIALNYKNDKCVIYAVGGDGTVNEVLNGIVDSENMLGVIPSGSGNDFYKTLLEIDEVNPVFDVGKINDMYFINTVCFGLDAEVANNIDIMKLKGVPKDLVYYASILYTFFKYTFKNMTFKVNKSVMDGKFTIVTICNGRYYGNGFNIAPGARYDDGMFDIYFVDELTRCKIINLILKLKKGKHESSPYMHKMLSDYLYVKSEEELVCNVDGEKMRGNEFEITLKKKKVAVYNNKDLVNKVL